MTSSKQSNTPWFKTDENGLIHTRYGSYKEGEPQPDKDVTYFLLNEHVKIMLNKERDRFISEIEKAFISHASRFKKSMESTNEKLAELSLNTNVRINDIKSTIIDLVNFVTEALFLNKLKIPDIKMKDKKEKKDEKIEKEVKSGLSVSGLKSKYIPKNIVKIPKNPENTKELLKKPLKV